MMIIAVPVLDEELMIFNNTGHSPYFAIFESKGSGMFKNFQLLELRKNPRGNKDAKQACSHSHDEDHEEHVRGHLVLGDMVKGVDVVLVKFACPNTTKVMQDVGANIKQIPDTMQNARDALPLALA